MNTFKIFPGLYMKKNKWIGSLIVDPYDQQIGIVFDYHHSRKGEYKVYWPNFEGGMITEEMLATSINRFKKID